VVPHAIGEPQNRSVRSDPGIFTQQSSHPMSSPPMFGFLQPTEWLCTTALHPHPSRELRFLKTRLYPANRGHLG